MKYKTLILFLSFISVVLYSQPLFNHVYRLDSAQKLATTFYSIGVNGNKIYLAGTGNVKFDSTSFISYGFLSQLDMSGILIKNNYYGKLLESTYYNNNAMFMDKNSINLIGSNFDSSITFIKTDFNGEILIRKKYYPNNFPDSRYGNPASIAKFGKGYVLTTYNAFFTNRPTKTSVLIIDTLGNNMKSFDFDEGILNCAPSTILVNSNKNLNCNY